MSINNKYRNNWVLDTHAFIEKYHINAHFGSIKLRFKNWSTLSNSPTNSTKWQDFTIKYIKLSNAIHLGS